MGGAGGGKEAKVFVSLPFVQGGAAAALLWLFDGNSVNASLQHNVGEQ